MISYSGRIGAFINKEHVYSINNIALSRNKNGSFQLTVGNGVKTSTRSKDT
jgi:hypothetical protein